jgi:type IV secretion system protein VirB10
MVSEPDQDRSERNAEPAAAFRLRSEAPPVMRLSRRVLTGLVGVAAIVVFGALIFALQTQRRSGGGAELYNTDNKTTPDGLSALPRDYVGVTQDKPQPEVPRLGPPAPGDIGRPQPARGLEAFDPEQQRLAQENEAARTSHLFATISTKGARGGRPARPCCGTEDGCGRQG